jgi:hypothetical protein
MKHLLTGTPYYTFLHFVIVLLKCVSAPRAPFGKGDMVFFFNFGNTLLKFVSALHVHLLRLADKFFCYFVNALLKLVSASLHEHLLGIAVMYFFESYTKTCERHTTRHL